MPAVITCDAVSKSFTLRTNRQYLLKDRVLASVRPHLRETRGTFWALQDVSFTVESGESFGVIGPNGSGKTTLFRIIAGIYQPSAGTIEVRGHLAPLLALGVGFHPELTGRENIYLSAALLGLTTREIRDVEAAIIDFSELGQFIDVATKNYSAGMGVRLAFSIAAQVKPDIVLIDEVFAVGDAHFQQKCLRLLEDARRAGRMFIVATHDLAFVEERCDRALLLISGRAVALGTAKEVSECYRDLSARQGSGL